MLYDWRWVHGWGLFKLTATRGSACRRRRWRRASRSSRPCRAAEPGGPAPRRSGTASSRGPWRRRPRPRSASLLPRRRRRRRRRYRRLRWTPARLSRLSRWTPAGWRCWSWRVWLAAAPTIRSPAAAAAAAAAPLVAVWEKWWRRRWATLVVHSSSNFDERDSKLHTRTHTHTHTHTHRRCNDDGRGQSKTGGPKKQSRSEVVDYFLFFFTGCFRFNVRLVAQVDFKWRPIDTESSTCLDSPSWRSPAPSISLTHSPISPHPPTLLFPHPTVPLFSLCCLCVYTQISIWNDRRM